MSDHELTTKKQADFDQWVNDYSYRVVGSYVIDKQEVTGQVIEVQRRDDADGKFVWGRALVRVP